MRKNKRGAEKEGERGRERGREREGGGREKGRDRGGGERKKRERQTERVIQRDRQIDGHTNRRAARQPETESEKD